MKLLLDTHVLLWWLEDPKKLSSPARKAIQDGRNMVYVSAVVAWEIIIKKALDKLVAPDDLEGAIEASRFLPLPITIPHVLAVRSLPEYHRDPFDRMLIAQALHEGFQIVTRDLNIARYPVPQIVA
jgi:PIN domain nuclease of toxin-antitoxin system